MIKESTESVSVETVETTIQASTLSKVLLPSVKLPLTKSYLYASPVPVLLAENRPDKVNEPCVLGVDEAGRGPCLGNRIQCLIIMCLLYTKKVLWSMLYVIVPCLVTKNSRISDLMVDA